MRRRRREAQCALDAGRRKGHGDQGGRGKDDGTGVSDFAARLVIRGAGAGECSVDGAMDVDLI